MAALRAGLGLVQASHSRSNSTEAIMTEEIDAPIQSRANKPTKAAIVGKLLSRPRGALLGDIAAATGWQTHNIRAFLTGLRKKGVILDREQRRDGATGYRIIKPGPVPPVGMIDCFADLWTHPGSARGPSKRIAGRLASMRPRPLSGRWRASQRLLPLPCRRPPQSTDAAVRVAAGRGTQRR